MIQIITAPYHLLGNAALQQGAALPTSMPKPVVEADMNTLDPTHNRDKAKIINSFITNQEQVETLKKPSKGGKVKSFHARSQLSLAPALREAQVGHRCDALPVEVWITLERTAMRMFSAQDAEQGLTPQKYAVCPKNRYE